MSDQPQGAHRAGAEPVVPDLDPEVEQTWLRPRGKNRYPGASIPLDPADSTDTLTQNEPVVAPRAAVSGVSHALGPSTSLPHSGRRASAALDAQVEAAERLAADRAAVAAQADTLRRVAQRRREAEAVRPRASIEGGVQQVLPPRSDRDDSGRVRSARHGAPDDFADRRLVAGGVFERPLDGEFPARSAHAISPATPTVPPAAVREPAAVGAPVAVGEPAAVREPAVPPVPAPPAEPGDVATRAIAIVRQAGPGPTADASAVPFAPQRTLVMGVLNVTLDSFSDGGRYARFDDAIAHARSLVSAGADIVDVGGESTRPGAPRVGVHEEQRRVIPVIRELASLGYRVSVDTMNAATALLAVEAGADIINDVSGGLADRNMAQVVADADCTYIAMHWRGHSDVMAQKAVYRNAVAEVKAELFQRVAELVVQGVNPDRIVIDPGLGFAKLAEHNWQLLGHLAELGELGLPILVAASRKRFLGGILPEVAGVRERDPATAVISALAGQAGAWGVRVHDVASTRAALDVWEAWQKGSRG